uniref:Retrotransposon gag domain-containing protein n=1 Tax=Leersia perrieri TaxID=77586 RepID=A0A0D9XC94_9ORYZ
MEIETSQPVSTPTQPLNSASESTPTPIIDLESTSTLPRQQGSTSTRIQSSKITPTQKPRSLVFKTSNNPEVFHLYGKLTQEPIESFGKFTRRVLQALDQVKPVSDQLALSIFYHSLTNRDMIRIWHRYEPKSIKDLMQLANIHGAPGIQYSEPWKEDNLITFMWKSLQERTYLEHRERKEAYKQRREQAKHQQSSVSSEGYQSPLRKKVWQAKQKAPQSALTPNQELAQLLQGVQEPFHVYLRRFNAIMEDKPAVTNNQAMDAFFKGYRDLEFKEDWYKKPPALLEAMLFRADLYAYHYQWLGMRDPSDNDSDSGNSVAYGEGEERQVAFLNESIQFDDLEQSSSASFSPLHGIFMAEVTDVRLTIEQLAQRAADIERQAREIEQAQRQLEEARAEEERR